VLILTPVKDAQGYLDAYVERILGLRYPADALSIGLLEGDSRDATWDRLNEHRAALESRCRRVTLIKRDFGFRMPAHLPRWTPALQLARRATLARARNHLLFGALRDEDHVLWLDVDVIAFPADLIEGLLSHGLDILQPHCVTRPGGPTFDQNGWSHHGARHLDSYRGAQGPVRLDSVGGTVLLIKADLHRDGLIFPPFRYGAPSAAARPTHPVWGRGEIETEGLGVMASDMGLQCWGLPDMEVLHADG
jgi:peptide chain release factor subunit 1